MSEPMVVKQGLRGRFDRDAGLIAAGWLGTGLALASSKLPVNYLLKDGLGLDPEQLARFMAIAGIPIYIKPFAGILSDAVPLCGTRRYHYLLLGLVGGGLLWVLLGTAPRTFQALMWTYFVLNIFLTVTSTVLGGLMVELGKQQGKTGRLSAQRLGIVRFVELLGGPIGGLLAKGPFALAMGCCGALYLALVPLFARSLREPRTARTDTGPLRDARRQFGVLMSSRTLWAAAGLVILVIAAPGFNIPLFFYQTNTLKLSKADLGWLQFLTGAFGILGAFVYGSACRRLNLRRVLGWSIVVHALATLLYLAYDSRLTAYLITPIEGMTNVLALLPLYDLAARATPRGSEALGYSLMMSVWNFTHAMSDWAGSWMFQHWHLQFQQLVWINAGTTILVLFAVPFLPKVLMDWREGQAGGN